MPSPEQPAATASNAQPTSAGESGLSRSKTSTPQQGQGHYPPEANGVEQNTETAKDRQDVIKEGKQKAKAVLAAGMADTGSHQSKPPSRAASNTPETSIEANGAPLTRKRSRSGSRKISAPASPSPSDPPKARPTYNELTLAQTIARSQIAAAAVNEQADRRDNLLRIEEPLGPLNRERIFWRHMRGIFPSDPGQHLYGRGFEGYGNGWTARFPIDPKDRIMYPRMRKRPGRRDTAELRIPRKDRDLQADQLEQLVPIRLDIDHEKIRLRDTFTWNVHDRTVPPELFASMLVEDFRIPPEYRPLLITQVGQAVTEQISDYHPHVFIDYGPLDPHLPYSAYKNDEMRVLIKLNITIGQHSLVDQFDWDINNIANSPEEFAMRMAKDLSLSGEFMTAIAHSIREQTQMFTKSLFIAGHPFDGRPIEDPDVRENLLPSPLPSVFRSFQSAKDFTPYFYELSEADLEKTELAFSREQRQQKRSVNRRGGPSLPDLKERLRTSRTMIVSSVIPGSATNDEESGLLKPTRTLPGRGRKLTRGENAGDSGFSESEDSDQESPTRGGQAAAALLTGTSRTRGVRGAATAAQVALRTGLARSATPESFAHHHETRTSIRRFGGQDGREESVQDDGRLLVRLKVGPKVKAWLRDYYSKKARDSRHQRQSSVASQHHQRGSPFNAGSQTPGPPAGMSLPPHTSTPNPRFGTPVQANNASTPPVSNNLLPGQSGQNSAHTPSRMSANPGPFNGLAGPDDAPPPPPEWLTSTLPTLRLEFPNDNFEPVMRLNNKRQWQPRLVCRDCTGILYNTDPNDPLANFRLHLNNGKHRERVANRVRSQQQ